MPTPDRPDVAPSAATAALLDALENDRRALARDLHDDLGQILAALRLSAHALAAQLQSPIQQSLTDDILVLADEAVVRVRAIAHGLHPPQLDTLGLAAALEALCTLQSRGAVEVALQAQATLPRATPARELALYRIAQEAIGNALRHAGARRVQVDLHADADADALRLRISDDGRGFDVDAAPGFGRRSMRERATLAGGRLEETSSGSGTQVAARVPLGDA
jgi:signal transduction histidine kinase